MKKKFVISINKVFKLKTVYLTFVCLALFVTGGNAHSLPLCVDSVKGLESNDLSDIKQDLIKLGITDDNIVNETNGRNFFMESSVESILRAIIPSKNKLGKEFEFSESDIKIIDSHPLVQRLRAELEYKKADMNFLIERFSGKEDKTSGVGEKIQSLKLIAILKIIFPDSNFYGGEPLQITNGHKLPLSNKESDIYRAYIWAKNNLVEFNISDSAERRSFIPVSDQKSNKIEMMNIKPVLLNRMSRTRQKALEELNIPTKIELTHLYDRFSDGNRPNKRGSLENPSLANIFEKMLTLGQKNIIFTPRSDGGGSQGKLNISSVEDYIPDAPQLFDSIVSLSQVMKKEVELDSNKTNLIINDTYGLMRTIHAASQTAVIVGPINFVETLSVSTPTILFANKDSGIKRTYSWEAIEYMIGEAKQYSQFLHIENWNDYSHENLDWLHREETSSESLENLALGNFLTILVQKIRDQLGVD